MAPPGSGGALAPAMGHPVRGVISSIVRRFDQSSGERAQLSAFTDVPTADNRTPRASNGRSAPTTAWMRRRDRAGVRVEAPIRISQRI